MNPLARQIFRTLVFDADIEWNISKLAERFGYSRPKVREVVNRNVEGGYMLREKTRILISEKGSEILYWVHGETCKIALGEQVGFSEELIRHFTSLPLPIVDARAATISFQNDLNLF